MKKLSNRGIATAILIGLIIVGTIAICVVNNIQEVQSRQWREEIKLTIE